MLLSVCYHNCVGTGADAEWQVLMVWKKILAVLKSVKNFFLH